MHFSLIIYHICVDVAAEFCKVFLPFLSDHQHCIRSHQGLTGQPGLFCISQRPLKPAEVGQPRLHEAPSVSPDECVSSPSSDPFITTLVRRPAIVVLLMSMVNERQPFVLRCAVLYCFQCFLYKNQKGQGEIVATLLPSTIDGQ